MSMWMAETLIASTLLMALVMLLRRPVARWLGAGAAYLLWVLPLARMALPTLPREVASVTPIQVAIDQAGLPSVLSFQPGLAPVAAAAPALPWLEMLVGAWALGALLFAGFHLVTYLRFRRLILRDAVPAEQDGRLRIVASPLVTGPLAFGVLQPYVVLPLDFASRFDAQEQALAVAHERAHHERGDLAANMVSLAVLALHWWNPIAWIAYRAFRADQELACDARVLAAHGPENAHAYGRAILKAASGRPFAAACHLNRIDSLKGRLKMLSNHAATLNRISMGMAAVAILTVAGLALTASGSRAAQQMATITQKMESVNMTRLASFVAPRSVTPPAAPQAPEAPAAIEAPQAPEAPTAPAAPAAVERPAPWSVVAPVAPAAPVAPIAPTADLIAPVPPVPPVSVTRTDRHVAVRHADGRIENHDIPSARDLRRTAVQIDIQRGCNVDRTVVSDSMVTDRGRAQRVSVRICEKEIARNARSAAIASLGAARAQVAATQALSAAIRAEVLHDLETQIAELRAERD